MTETNHIAEILTILHEHGYEVTSLNAEVSDDDTVRINDASVRPSDQVQIPRSSAIRIHDDRGTNSFALDDLSFAVREGIGDEIGGGR
jgi:hypothetical protein